ncbi:sensor histidine kinase [Pedobacter foliorum]|uniref:sensor histidine kinase n=1 Tax=Pedobacter foliorum TaxID=2739058 RepID=UPI0015650FBF|nr:histidine kinase [Pedobacter foliorum]NRF39463.1 histidine kinase [Pedobacter foliorum]
MISTEGKTDKYLPVLLHSIAWCMYLVLVYSMNDRGANSNRLITYYGLGIFFQAIIFYINFSYLLPNIYKKIKPITWILTNLGLLYLFSVLFLFIQFPLSDTGFLTSKIFASFPILLRAISNGWFVLLAIVIRFSVDWFKQKYRDRELENEKLKTELSFLKSQINPHFFFNALNNLYSLTLKNSPQAPGTILQISKIMRYLLYETGDKQVPLSIEIEILKDYIALHGLKSKDEHKELLTVRGEIGNITVEPLLFLPLVENVFKHGADPLSLELSITKETFVFKTSNQIKSNKKKAIGGIGLQNLERRLHLLYPGCCHFEIIKEDNNFTATMTIQHQQL